MSLLQIILLVVAGLVVAGLVFLIIQFKTFQHGVHTNDTFRVDRVTVPVKIHYAAERPDGQPPLPPMILRWLKVYGFAMLGHIWLWFTWAAAPRELVAHELMHRVLQHIIGGPRYVVTALFQWATQWRHNRRGMEEEAARGAVILAQAGAAEVTVNGRLHVVDAAFLMRHRR